MRKFFRIASFALLLGVGMACSNEDVPEQPQGTYPILFRCTDETRAVATVDTMKGDANGFDVYAFFTSTAAPNGLSFTKNVKYDQTKSMWLYDDIEYWIPGATYWFKAVYPKGVASVDNDDKDQAVTISNFDITTQQDILVATTGEMAVVKNEGDIYAPTSGNTVLLDFKHLLANVTIKVKSQIDGVVVSSVKLGGLDTNSTYNGSTWTTTGNTTSVTYGKATTLTKGAEFVDVTNGGILVIPASANKALTIEANKTYNVTLPAGTWESGKKYTYTLEIKQDDIIFVDGAPYVEEWDSENATGSVIIK